VASRIGVRDLGGPVKRCHGNREFLIDDFSISTRVWGPSIHSEDMCHRRIGTSGFGELSSKKPATLGIANS
jgi:hypothetical protein